MRHLVNDVQKQTERGKEQGK